MRTRRAVAAVFVGLWLVVLTAAPAGAHGGKLRLTVAGDGADGVTVQATWAADGHRLDEVVRLVLTATGEGGRKVGPVQLGPAAEGQGFYTTGPVLTPGRWRVTVSAPAPHRGEVTAEIQARAAATRPAPDTPGGPGGGPVTARAAGEQDGPWWPAGVGVFGVAVLVVAGTLVAYRRRR